MIKNVRVFTGCLSTYLWQLRLTHERMCTALFTWQSHNLKSGYQGKGVGPKIHSRINVCSRSPAYERKAQWKEGFVWKSFCLTRLNSFSKEENVFDYLSTLALGAFQAIMWEVCQGGFFIDSLWPFLCDMLTLVFSFSLSKSWQHWLTKQQQCLLVSAVSDIESCERCVYILCGPTDWRVPYERTEYHFPLPIYMCVL